MDSPGHVVSRVPVRSSLVWAAAVAVTTPENIRWAHVRCITHPKPVSFKLVHTMEESGTCSVTVRSMFGAIPVIPCCNTFNGDGDPDALRIRLRIGFSVRLALSTKEVFI